MAVSRIGFKAVHEQESRLDLRKEKADAEKKE